MELHDEQLLEDYEVDFDGFIREKDWKNARALLASLEENHIDCAELRRRMNIVMADMPAILGEVSQGEDGLIRVDGMVV